MSSLKTTKTVVRLRLVTAESAECNVSYGAGKPMAASIGHMGSHAAPPWGCQQLHLRGVIRTTSRRRRPARGVSTRQQRTSRPYPACPDKHRSHWRTTWMATCVAAAASDGRCGPAWRSCERGVVWTAEDIALATGGRVLHDGLPGPVWTDTRSLPAGCWFLALQGENFDGHDYLDQAQAKSCAGVIVSQRPPDGWMRGAVLVDDTLLALQSLGADVRRRFPGPVVAITGSCGKTTVKEMVALILSERFSVHATRGNFNNGIGLPLTLLSTPAATEVLVLELGMSAPGEIERLASLCQPDIRVVTCVAEAHLAGVGGSLGGVARAKAELVSTARPGDTVILNSDDPRVISMEVPEGTERLSFGSGPAAVVRSQDCVCRLLGTGPGASSGETQFCLSTPGEEPETVAMPCLGNHLSGAAAAAAAVGLSLGLPLSEIAASLSRFRGVDMRMEVTVAEGLTFINDAYNANPASMALALELLAGLGVAGVNPSPSRLVALLGDMLEQGSGEDEAHRNALGLCSGLGIDLVGVAGDAFCRAASAIGHQPAQVVTAGDSKQLAKRIVGRLGDGDIILVKGSRGMKMEAAISAITIARQHSRRQDTH